MGTQKRKFRVSKATVAVAFAALAAGGLPTTSQASPQFARAHQLACTACHELPPMLNENGLAFQASGYRLPASLERARSSEPGRTIPLAAWITSRYEDQGNGGASDLFLPKVELISGGALGREWSYFVEWRIVSLSLTGDGSLGDRGGRFEDLFAEWSSGRQAVKVGQFRSLNQVDVSLRLSASEPALFGNGLPTDDFDDPRLASLSRFSPSSRSPSLGYSFRSIAGERPGDGLFHFVTVPFTGEFSIPLGSEASRSASFELAGPKGVYAETFYRRGHRSVGAHAFVSDESWLATVLGTYDWRDLIVTGGFGVDDRDDGASRDRGSLQAEYLWRSRERWRAAAGLRVEDVSDDGRRAAYVPYLALAGPNTQHSFLVQLEYRDRDGRDSLVLDLSLLF